MMRLLAVVLISYVVASFGEETFPKIQISDGALKGSYRKSEKGRIFSAFVGIPYGKAPIGSLRYKKPIPADPWKEELDASKYDHVVCPQRSRSPTSDGSIGNEDCLVLNVYVPKLNSTSQLLPVIFYIHGGAFVMGSANPSHYGPELLMDKDVVLVIPNYRLGSFGFLSTEDEVVPGNNALKDQNLALRWTKKNIQDFGGDPDKITVAGQSAGGTCAHLHMLSPLSKDLIAGVIAQSGTAVGHWAVGRDNLVLNNTKKLANFLNCNRDDNEQMINCLRDVHPYDIIKNEAKFVKWGGDPIILFTPVVEKNNSEAFLTDYPINIIESQEAAQVPFITGITPAEGAMKSANIYSNPAWVEDMDKDFDRIIPFLLVYDENNLKATKKIRQFYLGDKAIDQTTKSEVTEIFTDALFLLGADLSVRLHSQYSSHPVYYFLFAYRGSESHSTMFGDSFDYGVCHGDELLYIFKLGNFPDYKPNQTDIEMTEIFTTIWENFAKTGDPTSTLTSLLPTKWEPVRPDDTNYYFMKDTRTLSMANELYYDRVKFWNDLNIIRSTSKYVGNEL